MNNETSNITDTQLDSGVYSDKNTLLPVALVLTFPVVVVVCLYACIFRALEPVVCLVLGMVG